MRCDKGVGQLRNAIFSLKQDCSRYHGKHLIRFLGRIIALFALFKKMVKIITTNDDTKIFLFGYRSDFFCSHEVLMLEVVMTLCT